MGRTVPEDRLRLRRHRSALEYTIASATDDHTCGVHHDTTHGQRTCLIGVPSLLKSGPPRHHQFAPHRHNPIRYCVGTTRPDDAEAGELSVCNYSFHGNDFVRLAAQASIALP